MRLTLLFWFFCLMLLGGGCVSVPLEQNVLSHTLENYSTRSAGHCDLRQLSGAPHPQVRNISALNADGFSLLSWNVQKGNHDQWENDLRRLGADYDIVTFQEAFLDAGLRQVLDEHNYFWSINTAFHLYDIATGVLTASKKRPQYTCALRTDEPIIRLPKTILINRFPLTGQPASHLLVANLHGINFELGVTGYKRQILALQEMLSHHQGPMIIAGDFNNWSDERSEVVKQLAASLSLNMLTYRIDDRSTVFGKTVDQILYRSLEALEHRIYRVATSDHNPLIAKFRVKRAN